MKKYIQPATTTDEVVTLAGLMQINVSDDGEDIGAGGASGGGGGDAKFRDDELEEVLNQQKDGWDGGLW